MSRKQRAEDVMVAFTQGMQYEEDWNESNVANALREAVEGLNIDNRPDMELSIEKHHFIRGQLFVKDAILRLADELKALSETEKVELRAELEAKKKENFQLVADAAMKEYEEKYGRDVFPVDEYWVYMVADYGATGEGSTHCLYLTQAMPYGDDFTEDNRYVPINSKQYRAVREFHEKFGTWMLGGLRFLSKKDFFTEYAYYIPPVMMKLSNKNCYKTFYTEVHYNFS